MKTGVIWWNLIDGWPQVSDAVVDYYYEKKLAYHYIKASQQPFCLMCGAIENWNLPVYAVNDTIDDISGTFTVYEDEKLLYEGKFSVEKNGNEQVCRIPILYSDQRLLLINWEANGKKGFNHYVSGTPPFSFSQYKKWLSTISLANKRNVLL